jgi:hypothetical protein
VEFFNKILGEDVVKTKLPVQCPLDGAFDPDLFEFIQFTSCRDRRDTKPLFLVLIERRLSIPGVEI